MVVPTCNDGIKNQNEIAVDCGGPCKQCLCADCLDTCFCKEDLINRVEGLYLVRRDGSSQYDTLVVSAPSNSTIRIEYSLTTSQELDYVSASNYTYFFQWMSTPSNYFNAWFYKSDLDSIKVEKRSGGIAIGYTENLAGRKIK